MEKPEVVYKREMNHNYMIIKASDEQSAGYEGHMLEGNHIEGLLKFRQRTTEDGVEFYYEITSRQPLSRILDNRFISYDEIRELLLSIDRILHRIEEFLLKEEQIILDPDYIYVDPENFSVYFCMIPRYSQCFPESLTELLQYILEKVNHREQKSVVLAYGLYHESLKSNYGMEDLLKYLSSTGDGKKKWNGFEREKECYEKEEGEEFPNRNTERKNPFEWEDKRNQDGENEWADTEEGIKRRETFLGEPLKGENREEVSVQENMEGVRTGGTGLFLFMLAVLEAAVYFILGISGFKQYGFILAVFLSGIYLVYRLCFSLFFAGKPKQNNEETTGSISSDDRDRDWIQSDRRTPNRVQRTSAREEEDRSLQILFQSIDDDSHINSESQEERNTQLLSESTERQEKNAVLESSSRDRETIKIPYVPFLIGKNKEMNDYVLDYPTVSRLHLRIDKKEKVFILTDMNSTNGTVVNGYKLEANETVSVKDGDQVQIAGFTYKFREY